MEIELSVRKTLFRISSKSNNQTASKEVPEAIASYKLKCCFKN